MLNDFATALTFLTILRIPCVSSPGATSAALGRSFSFFPVVGCLLGACWLALAYLISPWIPPLLLAVLLTAVMAFLTRALHLDGLADLADGVGGGYTAERRLEIMKDSRSGAFGAIALILAIVLKAAALDTLILQRSWPPMLLVPVLSRFAMALAAYHSTYARKEGGIGKPFLEHVTSREILLASLFSVAASILLVRVLSVFYLAGMLALVGSLRHLSNRWLGGITGDVLGAVNEITEVGLLCFAACAASNGW
jgi:adenosylcobinamide-GDP ribazoletransferase